MNKRFKYLSGALLLGVSIVSTSVPILADTPDQTNYVSEQVNFNVNDEDFSFLPTLSEEEINRRTQDLGEQIRQDGENSANAKSATTEQWSLVSTTNLTSVSTIATSYRKRIGTGMSESTTASFNFGAGTTIKGYKIDMSFSKSKTQMMYGPAYNDKVGGSSVAATHAYITAAQQGKVVKYKYKVTTSMGHFLRYEYRTAVVDGGTALYSQRANVGNPSVRIENTNRTKSKVYSSHSSLTSAFGVGKTNAMFF